MKRRPLGRTGMDVPEIAFGCGPVSGLMTGDDIDSQLLTVSTAINHGIDWFDTAPGYGNGTSEDSLGRAISELHAKNVRIATKVRVPAYHAAAPRDFVRRSVDESLRRLRVGRIDLLQLHNGLTTRRDQQPSSLSVDDVLGINGVADAMERLREEGLVRQIGLTCTGTADAMRAVICSGRFATIQVPFNILNDSAGRTDAGTEWDVDYGNVLAECDHFGMGAFAIRVFAGGALVGRAPSEHTRKTPYFPLDLFERDAIRSQTLHELHGDRLAEMAVRFALAHQTISSAIIGFGSASEVESLLARFD